MKKQLKEGTKTNANRGERTYSICLVQVEQPILSSMLSTNEIRGILSQTFSTTPLFKQNAFFRAKFLDKSISQIPMKDY